MPKPAVGSPEDQALWGRAEQLAQELLDDHDCAIANALDEAFSHKQNLELGREPETEFSERLTAEAKDDMEGGQELADRLWTVLHTWIFSK